MTKTRRNREIENIYYNASLYCDNPEEILSSFELMDAQSGVESYEPDFDEKLEADLEVYDSEEELMSDYQEFQKQQFDRYYSQLLQTKTRKEVFTLNEEVKKADIECRPDYLFSRSDFQTWRKAVNARFDALPKAGPSEAQVERFNKYTEALRQVTTIDEHIKLRQEVITVGNELQEKGEYIFSKDQADQWWAESNALKETISPKFPKEKDEVTRFSQLVEKAKGNEKNLKEIRNLLYQSKDISNNGKKPIYLDIKIELDSMKEAA